VEDDVGRRGKDQDGRVLYQRVPLYVSAAGLDGDGDEAEVEVEFWDVDVDEDENQE
jgi:hypothetical protein